MANQVPDPRLLNSWEDAFQYPLPVVRKLEQQLRKNIDDNRQKLRSLVGASYRDLLGTAEKIIEMDAQMQAVEGHLGDIGRKCNARAVERASDNYARMSKTLSGTDSERLQTMAQTKVLRSALSVAARTIKAGGDALLVSKLLVLARLLHKGVSESADPPPILDDLRRKLALLRRKLLSYIERALVKPDTERSSLAHTLCAYSLVSSSAPKDVLRHFLQARFQQLEASSETPSEASVTAMLDLYKQTLLDTRALFPRLFAEALSHLSNVSLLQDKQLVTMFELNIDVYGIWIPEDVRSFTPWVRHEQLTTAEVANGLASWAKQARAAVLTAAKDCVRREDDAHAVLDIRKKVLSQYLTLSTNSRDGNHSEAIGNLRDIFLERLEELAADRARCVGYNVIVTDQPSQQQPSHMWELALSDIGLNGGAVHFRQEVVDRRHGRGVQIRASVDKLDTWMSGLDAFWRLTQQMRSTKWDDVLDLDFDGLSDGTSIQDDLSKLDTHRLQDWFREAASRALHEMYSWVEQKAASDVQAAVLIRLLREIDQRRLILTDRFGVSTLETSSPEAVGKLHRRIAETVSETALQQYTTSVRKRLAPAVALWDGSTPLPVQPSPATFKLLASLHKSMSAAGDDFWSPAAVNALRSLLNEKLAYVLYPSPSADGGQGPPLTNGHAAATEDSANGTSEVASDEQPADESTRHKLLQTLFDAMYLQCITSSKELSPRDQGLQTLVGSIKGQLELDDASSGRLRKSANEYWKRTYLLFGLLATGSN
ncbi:hypothetical protein LTR36_000170 [Oleoguttula mirabilis]|uniref:Conserved oligomeric Golgi complex subunit 1 n=1 Tax=Oleoguttula mirabilis TaxID=1507867 RepID=A0AAV9JXS8_9PEZI|nr:hypothetical protein LTR36_000170 [Oleoguttula mirabilis]